MPKTMREMSQHLIDIEYTHQVVPLPYQVLSNQNVIVELNNLDINPKKVTFEFNQTSVSITTDITNLFPSIFTPNDTQETGTKYVSACLQPHSTTSDFATSVSPTISVTADAMYNIRVGQEVVTLRGDEIADYLQTKNLTIIIPE